MRAYYKWQRLKFCIDYSVGEVGRRLVRWSQRDSNYLRHAKEEWAIAFPDKDDMQEAIGEHVLDMVAMFGLEGHSGFSAGYARQYIDKALRFEPFSPLTGAESEWGEPFDFNGSQQNKRCGRIFRDKDGKAYNIEGKVFVEPSGSSYTGKDSRVYIEFPYIPHTEFVQVPA